MKNNLSVFFEKILDGSGVKLNGSDPWDIKIHDLSCYNDWIQKRTLGFGESYMDGKWSSDELDTTIEKLFISEIKSKVKLSISDIVIILKSFIQNRQSKSRSTEVAERHYDIGNDLYLKMLDKRMVYTCGYWKDSKNLNEAQEAKLDLICRKLNLKPGQHILDIGCGWGSFMKFAAEKYGVKCTGVTVSKEQIALGQEICKGLPCDFILSDYRDVTGKYDHVVSIGMFEHVGYKNYKTFMKVVSSVLKDDGLFLLHTIGSKKTNLHTDPWIDKYIFPNGMLPSPSQISKSIEGIFIMEDWHNFGYDYSLTLKAWHSNFINAWPVLSSKYSEKFKKMWEFYLLSSAGMFRAREIQLYQLVLSKKGVSDGYVSVR